MSVAIRPADADDSVAISALLDELGYRTTAAQIQASLSLLEANTNPTLVATDNGRIVGLLALHIARWLHIDKPIARVTALVVHGRHQRRGIGRKLIAEADMIARRAGCGTLELTTAVDRDEAQAFYRELGFEQTSVRFKRALS